MDSIRVRELNLAASVLATKIGMRTVSRASADGLIQTGRLCLSWRLADANSPKIGYIRLDCDCDYDIEGKFWVGFVTVDEAPDSGSKLVRIATKQLVFPWRALDGLRARQVTKSRFCKFAAEFMPKVSI